jgi:hypothetical protein
VFRGFLSSEANARLSGRTYWSPATNQPEKIGMARRHQDLLLIILADHPWTGVSMFVDAGRNLRRFKPASAR